MVMTNEKKIGESELAPDRSITHSLTQYCHVGEILFHYGEEETRK